MTPLNTEERRSSFFLFLLFLTVSIVLVTIAAFFGMEVPSAQNKLMKQQLTVLQANQDSLEKFAIKVSETVAALDKMTKSGVENADYLNNRVSLNLTVLGRQFGVDTTSIRGKMFLDVTSSLQALQIAEQTLRKSGDNQKTIEDLTKKLADQTARADGLQRDADDLRSRLQK
jgi:hypothetical protein